MTSSPLLRFVVIAAGFVIIIAGMQAAAYLVNILLLSATLAVMFYPAVHWLEHRGLSTSLSLAIVTLGILIIGLVLIFYTGNVITVFIERSDAYAAELDNKWNRFVEIVESYGFQTSDLALLYEVDSRQITGMMTDAVTQVGTFLTNGLLILFTVLFMLLESHDFTKKLQSIAGINETAMKEIYRIGQSIQGYLVIKTWISLATGVSVAVLLTLLGIDFPIFWGFLAFLLNYIPNIGSIIAAFPPMILGFVQYGLSVALLVAGAFLIVNILVGYIIEPRYMGRGLDLSTLVVLLALIFWGWVLGATGLLLAIPLTIGIKIILQSSPETQWVAVLLGATPPGDDTAREKALASATQEPQSQ